MGSKFLSKKWINESYQFQILKRVETSLFCDATNRIDRDSNIQNAGATGGSKFDRGNHEQLGGLRRGGTGYASRRISRGGARGGKYFFSV